MLPVRFHATARPIWLNPAGGLWSELDRFFDRWAGESDSTGLPGTFPVDIREDSETVTIEADLPGFIKDNIEVNVEDGVLTISAQREDQRPEDGQTHLAERRHTQVARRFTVPKSVDESKVQAKLANGVLHLTLHKREEVKPRKIEVK